MVKNINKYIVYAGKGKSKLFKKVMQEVVAKQLDDNKSENLNNKKLEKLNYKIINKKYLNKKANKFNDAITILEPENSELNR